MLMRENQQDPLGRKFKDTLENYEPEFNPDHWADMQKRLQEDSTQEKVYRVKRWRYAAVVALAMLFSGSIWVYSELNSEFGLDILPQKSGENTILVKKNQDNSISLLATDKSIQFAENQSVKQNDLPLAESISTNSDNNLIVEKNVEKAIIPVKISAENTEKSQITSSVKLVEPVAEKSQKLALLPSLSPFPLSVKLDMNTKISSKKYTIASTSFPTKILSNKSSNFQVGLTAFGGGVVMPSNFKGIPFAGGGLTINRKLADKFKLQTGLLVQHFQFSKQLNPPIPENVVYALNPENNMLLIKRFVQRNAYPRVAYANWWMVDMPLGIRYQSTQKMGFSIQWSNQFILQENYLYEYEVAPLDGLPETNQGLDLVNKFYPLSATKVGLHFSPQIHGVDFEIMPFVSLSRQNFGKEKAQMNRYGVSLTVFLN